MLEKELNLELWPPCSELADSEEGVVSTECEGRGSDVEIVENEGVR